MIFFLNEGKYPTPERGCDLLEVTGIEKRRAEGGGGAQDVGPQLQHSLCCHEEAF